MKNEMMPVFPTIGAAAGQLGVSPSQLKRMKKAGCPAFLGSGRVDLGQLTKWLIDRGAEPLPMSLDAARAALAAARARLVEREAELLGGNVVSMSWLLMQIEDAFAGARDLSWFPEWVQSNSFHLAEVGREQPEGDARKEIETVLTNGLGRHIIGLTLAAKNKLLTALRTPPGADEGESLLCKIEQRLSELANTLSESAAVELRQALRKSEEPTET